VAEKAKVNTAAAAQASTPSPRSCFVVGPIGKAGSEARLRSDQLLRHLIAPVLKELGFAAPVRADQMSEPGRITRQIIERIMEDDLVIADLSDSNPNVYYELALRHGMSKPFIQLMATKEPLPFDIADQRTIFLNHRDLDSVADAREELDRQIRAVVEGQASVDSPFTFALDVRQLRETGDAGDRTTLEILALVQELAQKPQPSKKPAYTGADITSLQTFIDRLVEDGKVSMSDLESLNGFGNSQPHKQWVASMLAKSDPWSNHARKTAASSPAFGSANSAPWPDEPPF